MNAINSEEKSTDLLGSRKGNENEKILKKAATCGGWK
jgi:hypothetical protein